MTKLRELQQAIQQGHSTRVGNLLDATPTLANATIVWGPDQKNQTDPLHFVSDCVFEGLLDNGEELTIARLLLNHGAAIDGNEGRETPLIGATSLGVDSIAELLIAENADISRVALFGASALHWAAFMGMPETIRMLLSRGAPIEQRCQAFAATPLFWAVQGFSRYGPEKKKHPLGAAQVLLEAGANPAVATREGDTAKLRATQSDSREMTDLLDRYLSGE